MPRRTFMQSTENMNGAQNTIPRIKEAGYVKNHIIKIRFADGIEGEINLAGELDGEIFFVVSLLKKAHKLYKTKKITETLITPRQRFLLPIGRTCR